MIPSTRRSRNEPISSRLAARVLVAAAGEDEHVPGASRILDRAVERGGERVRHVFEDEPDRLGLPAEPPEHRRIRVTAIIELLDRAPDLRLERRADTRLAVDDARDGLQAHARESRDIEHRGAPRGFLSLL